VGEVGKMMDVGESVLSVPYSYLYHYKAVVTRVKDGDTIVVDIDLGMGVWVRSQVVRLYGIDAPSLYSRQGSEVRLKARQAKSRLEELVLNKEVVVRTIKDSKGKYGRWLGVVYTDTGVDVNQVLVDEQLAVVRYY
jgi:micrococcal nuclease